MPSQIAPPSKLKWLGMAIFLLAILFQGLYFAWTTGQTLDEPFYAASGYLMVRYNQYVFWLEHPPISTQLGALPLLFLQPNFPIHDPIIISGSENVIDWAKTGLQFLYQKGNNPYLMLFLGRLPMILLTMALGATVFLWAFELYGLAGALLSLSLFSFSPDILAHGSLFTTDMTITAFFFITIYRLKKFFEDFTLRNAVWVGLFCGLTMLSKISALVLFPIFGLIFATYYFIEKEKNIPEIKLGKWPLILTYFLFAMCLSNRLSGILFGPLCLVLIGFSWFEKGLPQDKKKYWALLILFAAFWIASWLPLMLAVKKTSLTFRLVASVWALNVLGIFLYGIRSKIKADFKVLLKVHSFIWVLAAVVIIFDHTDFFITIPKWKPFAHYISTFNLVLSHVTSNHVHCVPNSFISCDWRYFMTSMMAKIPLMSLTLFVVGIFGLRTLKIRITDKALIWLPPLIFLFVASFVNRINIGLRHVLPVYPFIFLIAGASIPLFARVNVIFVRRLAFFLIGFGVVLMIQRNLSTAPYYLSYFNELVGDAEAGARLTSDSNIDWGQSNRKAGEWAKMNGIRKLNVSVAASNEAEYAYHGVEMKRMSVEDFNSPAPGYYALDLHSYLAERERKASWFYQKMPDYKAGKTIYIFQVRATVSGLTDS
jgi:hypothetical protein